MIMRWALAVALLVVLPAVPVRAEVTFPVEKRGDMEARLEVRVADRAAEEGHAEVTLILVVTGPATLEVEPPRLGDALDAWKQERLASSWTEEDGRVTWCRTIGLRQVKAGFDLPLPELTVRFRDGPAAKWEDAKWVDILHQMRDGLVPPAPPPPPPPWWQRWLPKLAVAGVVLLLIGVGWWLRQRGIGKSAPLPAEQWALGEIDRIDRTLVPPQGDAETYHTQLSHVVRRYLAERFGLHALQQTTAEFLQAVRQVPQLAPAQHALLRDFFERCDLAKFARASTPPEECRHTAALARSIVRQTTPALSPSSPSSGGSVSVAPQGATPEATHTSRHPE